MGQTIYDNIDYIFPNAVSRLSSSGYVAQDGYKLAIDLDTKSIFTLVDWQNNLWSRVSRSVFGGGPLGTAGGYLTGSYPNPQVKDLTISGEVQGSILYYNGTSWVHLAPSNDGYVLTTHGSSQNPTWSNSDSVTNHSSLLGLSNDDHTQYLLTDGTRSASSLNITGNLSVGGTINSVDISSLSTSLSSHTSNTSNPHNTSIANLGSGTLLQLNNIISDADLDAAGTARPPTGIAGGDLTGTYPNPSISNNSVTFTKIQTIGTDSLLGRDTTGTGNIEEISLNSTLEMTGSGSLQRAAISGDITIPAGSNTASITSGVIVNTDINASAGINISKLETISSNTLIGNPTGSTSNPSQITLDSTLNFNGTNLRRAAISGDITIASGSNTATVTDLTISGEVQGSILYYNGTNWVQLSPGTNGNFLKTQGSGANPEWSAVISNNAFSDSLFRIQDNTDATKQLAFEVSSINTGTTRTITVPDIDVNLTGLIHSGDSAGGDLTGTYPNPTIINDAVTFSKIQNITTDRLLGRDTLGSGDIEEISLNSTLEFSGTGSIQRAAISGDITIAAGSNTADITAGSIVNTDINSSAAIAFTKLATITTNSLLGRDTAGTGALEVISVSGGLEFSGSGGIIRSALTGDVTANAGSNSTTIASNVVTFSKIQQITTDRLLGRDTATTGNVEEISLDSTLSWSGTGSIGRSAISGDITIASGSNTAAISSGVIVNSDINASAGINISKLESITASTLMGNPTGLSAVPSLITLDSTLNFNGTNLRRSAISGDVTIALGSNTATVTDLTITSEQQGSILYYNGTNWIQLSPGTSGQYLQTQGTAANPIWSTVSGGSNTFSDSLFRIQDNADSTKQLAFEVSGITTGTTRTITVPNANITIDDASSTRTPTDNTVSTTKLIDNSVTFAKIQDITTASLIGRTTAGSGDPELISVSSQLSLASTTLGISATANITNSQLSNISASRLIGNPTGVSASRSEISLGASLEFSGSTIQRAALTGDVTASANSNSTSIANNIVTFAKMQTVATDSLLGRDTAGTGNIESITLDSTLVFSGTGNIGRAAISGDITIASGSNTAAISSGVIINSDINSSAGINLSKLESITASTLVGNPTGAGAVPSLITLDSTLNFNGTNLRRSAISGDVTIALGSNTATVTDLTITSEQQGSILYYNGTNWVQLSPGTSGQYLQTQGMAANPQWNTVSSGSNNFSDSLFRIQDNADSTKQLAFEVSGITTATTRTITVPDANVNLTGLIHSGDSAGGDLTGTYPNPTINSTAVTFSKIQNITTDRLLGRDTASSGSVEEISLDSTLSWSGTGSIGRSAISGDITITSGSNTAAITSGVIINSDINASAGINLSKLESITASTLIGNPTGAGAVPSLITLNSTLSFSGTTLQRAAISGDVTIAAGSNTATVTDLTITSEQQGSILYYNGTNWVQLSPGTSGQYLQTQGTAANPQWATVSGGGGSPGGSNTQIQYNNAGAFAGATNITVNSNDLTLLNNASATSPSANSTKIFSKKIADRQFPAIIGPSGLDWVIQPNIFRNKIAYFSAAGGTGTTAVGVATTAVGTATSRTIASTNILTRMRRIGYVSATTAAAFSSIRSANTLCLPGNGSGLGGFFFSTRFSASDAASVSGARQFVGILSATGAATNVEPNTITNCIGLAQLSTDSTQYYIVYGGSAAQTAIATGVPIYNGSVSTTTGVPIEFSIYSKINENSIYYYEITNMLTNVSVTGTISGTVGTQVPANSTALTFNLWRCNNATAAAVGLDIISIYLETDI